MLAQATINQSPRRCESVGRRSIPGHAPYLEQAAGARLAGVVPSGQLAFEAMALEAIAGDWGHIA